MRRVLTETRLANSGHLPALDGLRGVAILLVMLVHFVIFEPRPGVENLITHLTKGGWTGVDLFFVLSGFLITGILLDAKGSPTYFRAFYGRRVLRIFPLYYAYLAVVLLLLPAGPLAQSALWFWGYGVNLLITITGRWPLVPHTSHLWSLAIEEQFYLLWPLLVWRLDRRMLLRLALAVLVGTPLIRAGLLVAHVPAVTVFVSLWTRWDALMAGAFIAIALRSRTGTTLIARYGRPVAGAAALLLGGTVAMGGGFNQNAPAMQTVGYSAIAVLSAVGLASVIMQPHSRAAELLSARWLRAFGRYAYALYLLQFAALELVGWCGLRADQPPRLLGSALAGAVLVALVAVAVAFMMAWVSWRVLESPILTLKRHFPYEPAPRSVLETPPVR